MAALTSRSHSLASLSELLKVATPKKESDEHGGALTADYVRYGLRDVQTTWECFDALAQQFATFRLNDTGLYPKSTGGSQPVTPAAPQK